jgi:hypothetical protein
VTDLETQLKKTAKRFAAETEHHEMKVLRRDGVYRHLRFMNPGDSAYWFEIHTGPRFLLFRGDGESYVFSNGGTDMFSLFRHGVYKDGSLHPDPGHWTQKLSTAVQAEKWEEEVFREDLEQYITDMVEQEIVPKKHEQRLRDEVEEHLLYEDLHSADLAIKALMEFDFYFEESNRYAHEKKPDFEFDECWEWISRCTEYDWWYLWALHGILYGVREFDRRFGIPGKKVDVSTAGVQVA